MCAGIPVIPADAPRGPFMVSSNVNPVDKHKQNNQNKPFRYYILTKNNY